MSSSSSCSSFGNYLFTSESVTEGHPDKLCDQVSDAILDAVLAQDPNGRVAVETATKTGMILVFGELTTTAHVDFQKVIRGVVKNIGYPRVHISSTMIRRIANRFGKYSGVMINLCSSRPTRHTIYERMAAANTTVTPAV